MKKISLKDIPEDEILSAKDLMAVLGDDSGSGSKRGSGSRGSGSKGSGSRASNCTPDPPLYICGDNCRTATGAASKCAINSSNQCTCGGM